MIATQDCPFNISLNEEFTSSLRLDYFSPIKKTNPIWWTLILFHFWVHSWRDGQPTAFLLMAPPSFNFVRVTVPWGGFLFWLFSLSQAFWENWLAPALRLYSPGTVQEQVFSSFLLYLQNISQQKMCCSICSL